MNKDFLKAELLTRGYFKHVDGRQLYELTEEELLQIYVEIVTDGEKTNID